MGIFDAFSKKKEQESVSLPPPPMPDDEMEAPEAPAPEEIEPISAPEPVKIEVIEEDEAPEKPRKALSKEGPVFVSMQDYQAILSGVNSIKSKLGEVDDSFKKLNHIKAGQEKELEDWRKALEDVQRKLTYVDEVLFGK